MRVLFHPAAEAEFGHAVDYYDRCRPGLGLELTEEVYAAVARIIRYPEAWSPLSKNTRRCLVHRFPYGIVYQVKSDIVRIIAVANLRRRPGYWRDRV